MLFAIKMVPAAEGADPGRSLAQVMDEIDRAGLRYRVNGADAVIEGHWDQVMPVLRDAVQRVWLQHGGVVMQMTMHEQAGGRHCIHEPSAFEDRAAGRRIPLGVG